MRKIIVRIFNLVFLVAAAMSIVSFLTRPLVSLQVSVSIPATQITNMMSGDSGSSKSHAMRDDPADFDITEVLTEENLKKEGIENLDFTFDISVTPENAKTYFDLENNYKIIAKSVEEFMEKFIDDAYVYIKEIMLIATKLVAKDVISEQVKDQISQHNSDPDGVFASTGCEEKVDKLVDKVIDEFAEGNVPISELAATITDDEECGVKNIVQTLKDANVEGFQDVNVDDITPDQIQEAMESALTSVPGLTEERPVLDADGNPVLDADGNPVTQIVVTDIATALITILDNINGATDNGSGDEHINSEEEKPVEEEKPENLEEPTEQLIKKVMRDETTPATDPSKEEELKQKVTEFIKGLIPFDIENPDIFSLNGIMPYVLLGVILLGIFPWALFAVLTIIRTIRKKKCWTKPWVVFFFGFTQLIFGIGLTLVFKFGTPLVMQYAGAAIPAEYASMLGGLNVAFQTAAFIPSIIYLAMIPVTIVYMIFAHGVKKEFKQFKKDKKLAKKSA